MSGDVFDKTLDKLLDVPFVFWRCTDHPRGTVTWDHRDGKSVATCDVCGKQSIDL